MDEETTMTDGPAAPAARVVVGVDGSRQSKQALRWACRIAASTGASLEAVAAWDYPAGLGWSAVPVEWDPEQDMQKVLTEAVDEVFGPQRPPGLQLTVSQGSASRVLLEQAAGAVMLVVGSRGHGAFSGLLGSVSTHVTEHAACPVLVVHGDTPPPEMAA
jgi:nucleotide-binding universal stress UspA family protein